MDTQSAIDSLQAFKNTIDSNAQGLLGQSDALATVISGLKGTLQTQLDESPLTAQIATLQQEVDSIPNQIQKAVAQAQSGLLAQIAVQEQTIADLQNQVVTLTTPALPPDLAVPADPIVASDQIAINP